jgi:amino acid adenylation domain-containing protein
MVAGPDLPISALPLLTQAEEQQLARWNDTKVAFPETGSVHALFVAQAKLTPDAVAVVWHGQRLNYAELNARANQLAHRLKRLGVGPESRVAICMERGLGVPVAMLGILKAGGAFLPLDPNHPWDRNRGILHQAGVLALITHGEVAARPAEMPLHVIRLEADWGEIAQESTTDPPSRATADQLAYVIYTSGSSGLPKGVMIPHGAFANRMLWGRQAPPLSSSDAMLQATSFSFDVSIWEVFTPLLCGARLVIARAGILDIPYLIQLIADQQVTILGFSPGLLQAFLEEDGVERCACLKHVFCGGEAMPRSLPQQFFSRLPGAALYNFYGLSEVTIDAVYFTCVPDDDQVFVPIGKPLGNVQAHVLDRRLQALPVGIGGDLYIGGQGIARGYLGQPELTSEQFLPDPFAQRPGARMYRTGDRVRRLADGNLQFLGRDDDQVKIRGFRIELSEVEAILRQHPAIQEAIVLAPERGELPEDKILQYLDEIESLPDVEVENLLREE